MISISLCMIVKDEELVLDRCLKSISDIVDEIIIVDTGSKDKTKLIAEKYTKKVYDFTWCDDFSKARNYSFSKATKDYIMWLDADDILLDKDRKKLNQLKKTLTKDVDIVMLRYNIAFDKLGNPIFSYNRERIIKNNKKYKWTGAVHEVIEPSGKVITKDIAITHKKEKAYATGRNLKIYEKLLSEGKNLDSRHKFYYARELYYNKKYNEAIKVFTEFLDSKDGWIENKINASIDLANCIYFTKKNDFDEVYDILINTFKYDIPRACICCELGRYFFLKNKYDIAIYWYKLATTLNMDISKGGFENIDYYGYIPYISICVCYYKLGKIEEANKYNEKAGKIKPSDDKYLYNKKYFEELI